MDIEDISDEGSFKRFKCIEDPCLSSLWSSQTSLFCFKTNPSTCCQGRDLFKRICTRPTHTTVPQSNSPLNRLLLGRAGNHSSLDAQIPEFPCWPLLLAVVHANLQLSNYFFSHSLHCIADTIYPCATLQVCETPNRCKTQAIQKSIFIQYLILPSSKQQQCLSPPAEMDPQLGKTTVWASTCWDLDNLSQGRRLGRCWHLSGTVL